MNTLTIVRSSTGYALDFSAHSSRDVMIALFDSPIVPLPFTHEAPIADVLADVRQRNPHCEVVCARF